MTGAAVRRRVVRSAGRRHRWALVLIVVAALGIGLAACSNGGADLARQACGHVDKSLTLFKQAEEAPDPSPGELAGRTGLRGAARRPAPGGQGRSQ